MTSRSDPYVTAEQVRKTAALARLSFSDEEIEDLREELSRILTYASILDEAGITDERPAHMLHAHAAEKRTDLEAPSLPRDEALSVASDALPPRVRVPRVL